MLIVTSCTARMPPHIRSVFKYHSGKFPLRHASAKLPSPNGPDGVREAMSGGTPGRSEATAIQANGTAQISAAALAAMSAQSRPSTLIMHPALDQAERDQRQGEESGDADHRCRRGEPGVVILRRLLIDVIEQEVGRVRRRALGHRHDVVDLRQ